MALKVGELYALLTLKDSGFNGTLDSAMSALTSLGTKIMSINTILAGIKLGVNYTATIEQMQTSFEVMTGSAEEAASIIETLQSIGAKTPYDTLGLAQAVQVMMAYGMSAQNSIDMLMTLGDVAQGSQDKLYGIALAYGQMTAKGKVQQQEINQMINQGFSPLQAIAETTGESMDELIYRMSEGTLSVDEVTAAMKAAVSEGGRYFGSMEKQSKTLNGQLSMLKDEGTMLLGEMTEPLSEGLKAALPLITDIVAANRQMFNEGGWKGWLGTLRDGAGFLSKLSLEGWENLLFGAPENPAGAYAIQLSNLQIDGERAITQEGERIANEFYTALQNGMSEEQALDFMVTWTGTGTDVNLPEVLHDMYAQFFPENPEPVEVPITPDITVTEGAAPDVSSITSGLTKETPVQLPVEPQVSVTASAALVSEATALFSGAGTDSGEAFSTGIASGISESSTVTAAASGMASSIQTSITGAISTARLQGVGISGALGAGISLNSGAVTGAMSVVAAGIVSEMAAALNSASSSGLNFSLGLAGGIRAGRSAVISAATSVAQAAIDAAQSTLKIHSPSKITYNFGEFFSEGFASGIMNSVRAVTGAASTMAQMAADAVSIRNPGAGVRSGGTTYAASRNPEIDYTRLGDAVADALSRRPPVVDLDGRRLTDAVSRRQNQNARARAMGMGK